MKSTTMQCISNKLHVMFHVILLRINKCMQMFIWRFKKCIYFKKTARFICLMEIFVRNKFQSIQINFHERKKSSENIRIWLQARKTRNRGEICSNQMIQMVSTKSNGTELKQNKNFSCSILLVGVKVSTKKRGKRKVIHHAVNNPNSFLY